MADDRQSRTEQATPRRLEKARQRGDLAFSRDLVSGVGLFAVALVLWFSGEKIGAFWLDSCRGDLGLVPNDDLTPQRLVILARAAISTMISVAGTVVAAAMVGHLSAGFAQAGFRVTFEPLGLKPEKLSPVEGWNRLFSMRSAAQGLQAIFKTIIFIVCLWLALRSQTDLIVASAQHSLPVAVAAGWQTILRAMLSVAVALVVIGISDYAFQWWRHQVQMRMSRQEIKDERKDDEGDPMVRARIKRVQREMANKRMLRDVAKASVVLTNPTHFAVALKYESGEMQAPKVVAKGVDELAMQIRKIAQENEVPILERKSLARTLYASVEVGDEIPTSLYHAIAEIMAYLYRIGRFQ